LTVTDATLVSITVSPDTDSVAKGLTRQFTAVGHYTDNSTQVLTELVTWSSSDNAVATLSNVDGSRGVATTAGVGVATVTAISGGVTGDALLTVTDASLVSIDVSPAVASITSGATQQLAATGHYTDNSTQDLTTQVTWISTDVAIATVSNVDGFNGLATGVGAGTTSVTANKNGLSGSAALTVTGVTPSTLDLVTALLNKVIAVGPGQSLTNHMANVQTYLAIPDIPSACTSLDTFKGVVADQRDKKIDPALADELTADADVIDAAIPCP
jgi:hypothetical protein